MKVGSFSDQIPLLNPPQKNFSVSLSPAYKGAWKASVKVLFKPPPLWILPPGLTNATDFGDAEVEVLVQHLTPVLQEAAVDPTKFADEWKHLRLQHMVSLAGCSTSRQSPGQNQTGSMQVNTPMCSS